MLDAYARSHFGLSQQRRNPSSAYWRRMPDRQKKEHIARICHKPCIACFDNDNWYWCCWVSRTSRLHIQLAYFIFSHDTQSKPCNRKSRIHCRASMEPKRRKSSHRTSFTSRPKGTSPGDTICCWSNRWTGMSVWVDSRSLLILLRTCGLYKIESWRWLGWPTSDRIGGHYVDFMIFIAEIVHI
jgi:hypothetical protein